MSMVIPKPSERKYEPYSEYKDSGIEWLGEIPAYWDTKKLKHMLFRNDGGVWGDDYDENGTIVLRSTEQTVGGEWHIDEPAIRHINAEEYKKSKLICEDLLITKSSGSELHIGKTTLVTREIEDMNCCFSNFMQRIRLLRNYSAKYIYYVFNCILGREQLVYYSNTTTGLANLSSTIIGNIHIAVPDYSEQQTIAVFLDRETAKIDELIAKKQKLIELLQEQRTALITYTVTKGLNPDVPMKDSGMEWLGKIPEHWEVKKLKHVLLRNDGGVWGDDYDENGTIVLRSTEQTIGGEWCINEPAIRRINAEEYKKTKLICGDLLITKSSGSELHIGKTTLVTKKIEDMNCCFSNFMQRIRLLSNYSAKYIYYVFNCILGREQLVYYSNTTTGLANLSSTIIDNIHIAIPNYSEQQAITDYLDQETSRIDDLVSRINQAIEKLKEYHSALITAAVIGKIDVRQYMS